MGADGMIYFPEGNTFTDTMTVLAAIVFILTLRKFISIFPTLIGCLLRWKEARHMEYSVKLSEDQDFIFMAAILPFCITANAYSIYSPDFISGINDSRRLLVIIGVTLLYTLLRWIVAKIFRNRKFDRNTSRATYKLFYSYFIIATIIMVATSGILGLGGVSAEITRMIMLYEILAVYLIFIVRKSQIFSHSCSVLTTILYLCALEILPTGLLVVSATIF